MTSDEIPNAREIRIHNYEWQLFSPGNWPNLFRFSSLGILSLSNSPARGHEGGLTISTRAYLGGIPLPENPTEPVRFRAPEPTLMRRNFQFRTSGVFEPLIRAFIRNADPGLWLRAKVWANARKTAGFPMAGGVDIDPKDGYG